MFDLYLILHAALCLLERYLEKNINTTEIVESFVQSDSAESEQEST